MKKILNKIIVILKKIPKLLKFWKWLEKGDVKRKLQHEIPETINELKN
jgi:hypothetical protein